MLFRSQVVERAQVFAPVGVDALQHNHALELGELLATDLTHLGLERCVRCLVLIGRDARLIERALAGRAVFVVRAPSLPRAVEAASRAAHQGDVVLLSPACASFDMFRDYKHRAEVFRAAVQGLNHERAS